MKRRNNNKKLKIIIGIIVFILALIATYIILIIKDILPNPLLDTSDLVCVKELELGSLNVQENVVFEFNNRAEAINYQMFTYNTYYDYESAKIVYDENKYREEYDLELIESENKIKITYNVDINNDKQLKNKQKTQLVDLYTIKYGYSCK